MILTEENNQFLNDIKEEIDSSNLSSIQENITFIEYVKKKGNLFELKEGFLSFNTRSTFVNALKAIESIYIGRYEINVFKFNYQELTNFFQDKMKIPKRSKFIPKTPILLYDSSNKILKKYLPNFSDEIIPYNELFNDILSLLFYFKIPIIKDKWIEELKRNKNRKKYGKELKYESSIKNIIDEKQNSNENFEKIFKENDSQDLNGILKKIITILYDLLDNIKEII